MKKLYQRPVTETVNVKLYGAILDDPTIPIINNSTEVTDEGLGKKNDLELDFEDGNVWEDGFWSDNSNTFTYDLWSE